MPRAAVRRCSRTWAATGVRCLALRLDCHDRSPPAGWGYVGGFDNAGDKITFSVDSPSATLYDVTIRYATPYGEKYTRLVLNGGSTSDVFLPARSGWQDAAAGQLLLRQGQNTIDLVSNWGW
jgi:mannan endo-1,4-beta-mannosidase